MLTPTMTLHWGRKMTRNKSEDEYFFYYEKEQKLLGASLSLKFWSELSLKLVTHRSSYLLSGKQNSISSVLAGEIHVNNFFSKVHPRSGVYKARLKSQFLTQLVDV